MNLSYATICDHGRLVRLNDHFVRCLTCGQSINNPKQIQTNKTGQDFSRENPSYLRNFNRNFSNIIEETDEPFTQPLYEYYVDRRNLNLIMINKSVQFMSYPPQYEVTINGEKTYLDDTQMRKLLADLHAIRIDASHAKNIMNKKIEAKLY